MGSLFPASDSMEASSLADIQLLADGELLSLWEQTQIAASTIEARGGNAFIARLYDRAIVMEMRRRQAFRPSGQPFGAERSESRAPSSHG